MTQTELNQIQSDEKPGDVPAVDNSDNEDEAENEEIVEEGEVNPKEYDYLLTMPLWALSEEKIEELSRSLSKKVDEHDTLEGTHIHEIWKQDLEVFLQALDQQEEKDEKARLANAGVRIEGKKGGRRKANKPKAPKAIEEEQKKNKNESQKQGKQNKQDKPQDKEKKEKKPKKVTSAK